MKTLIGEFVKRNAWFLTGIGAGAVLVLCGGVFAVHKLCATDRVEALDVPIDVETTIDLPEDSLVKEETVTETTE